VKRVLASFAAMGVAMLLAGSAIDSLDRVRAGDAAGK